jgi:hypothetical protein
MEKDSSFLTFNAALHWIKDTIQEHFPNHKLFDCSGGLITFNQLKRFLKEN